MDQATGALLDVRDIVTYYGHAQALRGVSLQVRAGEIVAILGANGAGKSTTLLTVSGLLRARTGVILFDGHPIGRMKPSGIVKRGISHCPEGRALFPEMTVEDNLRLGAFLRTDREAMAADLGRVYQYFPRLQERTRQLAGSLSGGEQQMLAIGRALMSRPKLLLLDEPSLGLSPMLVGEMFRIISGINAEGTAVLLVEQNVGAALEAAHRAYVMETGRIAFAGSRDEVLHNDQVRRAYLGG